MGGQIKTRYGHATIFAYVGDPVIRKRSFIAAAAASCVDYKNISADRIYLSSGIELDSTYSSI